MSLGKRIKEEVGNPLSPHSDDHTVAEKVWKEWKSMKHKKCGCDHKHA